MDQAVAQAEESARLHPRARSARAPTALRSPHRPGAGPHHPAHPPGRCWIARITCPRRAGTAYTPRQRAALADVLTTAAAAINAVAPIAAGGEPPRGPPRPGAPRRPRRARTLLARCSRSARARPGGVEAARSAAGLDRPAEGGDRRRGPGGRDADAARGAVGEAGPPLGRLHGGRDVPPGRLTRPGPARATQSGRAGGRRDRSKVALLQSVWCRATLLQQRRPHRRPHRRLRPRWR